MSDEKKLILTEEGLIKLRDELENLKNVQKKEIAVRLKKALSYGDLKENFEYQEAKESQGLNEARISELEDMLKNVEILKEKKAGSKADLIIDIGSRIKIRNVSDNDKPEEFTIVGTMEADPFNGRISNETPIGEAAMGKKLGDKFDVQVPAGEVTYEIVSID